MSWLYCSASEAWSRSQTVSADGSSAFCRISDSTSRAEDEPIALPSSCSEKWMKAMSAGLSSASFRPTVCSYDRKERSMRSLPR